jgi:uncharacterized protein YggE
MDTQPISRGTAAVAAAAVLGAAFYAGSLSGRPARAATLVTSTTSPSTTSSSTSPPAPGITVNGTAQVAGRPDTLRLDLSVSVTAGSVGEALGRANTATAKVQAALRRQGVAVKDLQTSTLQVHPEYTYPSNGQPVVNGYRVSEGVTATLRDLGKAGGAINAVVAAGGNAVQVNGVQLDLADTSALVRAARDKAVATAKAKAEQYADAIGRDLGDVVSLTESVTEPPPAHYSRADATAAVPIAPGSQEVSVTVTVVYGVR